MNICVLNFTQNNILLIKLYMELKSKQAISLLRDMKEGRYCTVRWTAVNQIKLVSVRKGTVVKVFQAWWTEVGSIEPQSRPETWENAHTDDPNPPEIKIYIHMYKQTQVQPHTVCVYTKNKCGFLLNSLVCSLKKNKNQSATLASDSDTCYTA